MSNAIVFGTFAPMHTGHVDIIHKAKRENEHVFIVVSGYKGDRGDSCGLTLEARVSAVEQLFKNDSLITVIKLDESNIPRYPNGWSEWLNILQAFLEKTSNINIKDCVFYVAEQEYLDELTKRLYKAIYYPRQFNISATKIRNNPIRYWNNITYPFRAFFTKKILVIGSASNGKTTLVNDLGRLYQSPISLEYARECQTKHQITDENLQPIDFYEFLIHQYQQTQDLMNNLKNNGIIICDSDAITTKAYFDYYMKEHNQSEQKTFNYLFESMVSKEKWDLILFIHPTGKYVDDGFRDMTMSHNIIRKNFTEYLLLLINKYFPTTPIHQISTDYNTMYQVAKEMISEIMEGSI